jgi:hypothetical protein
MEVAARRAHPLDTAVGASIDLNIRDGYCAFPVGFVRRCHYASGMLGS